MTHTVTDVDGTDLSALDLNDLRTYRQGLIDEEVTVSYWRRVVQARLDLLDVQRDEQEHVALPDLIEALGGQEGTERRPTLLRAPAEQPPAISPELGALWLQPLHLHDPSQVAEVRRDSGRAEARLSARRHVLFALFEEATTELVRRYACEPEAALELLPDR